MALTAIIVSGLVFAVLGGVCVFTIILGLPGAWMLLALAVLVELADTWWLGPGAVTFGWGWLAAVFVAVALAEVFELVGGAAGVKATGGGRAGMVGAFLGGLVGGLVGTALLPVVGTLVGAFLGTFLGALLGERWSRGKGGWKGAVGPALGATVVRVLAMAVKLAVALSAWLVLTVLALWP